ncbi:MAG: hypothetical protein V6Z78_01670 [Holosporaceae bacterium]
MSSLKNKFSILTLVLLSAQFVPQVLRPSAASELLDVEGPAPSWQAVQPCALQEVPSVLKCTKAPSVTSQEVTTKGVWQAPHRFMSAALWPLDCLKKASMYVLKSPYLFLMATSALLPGANAYQPRGSASRHPIVYDRTALLSPMHLGLTEAWDTNTCQGRALHATDKKAFLDTNSSCRTQICAPHMDETCDNVALRSFSDPDLLDAICDDLTCAPRSIHGTASHAVQQAIARCRKEACQQTGRPYTGHFSCATSVSNINNATARNKIDEILFKANACFETFCQTYAHNTCPKETSWWQSLFGLSPCNSELCEGRFVSNENKEVSPGVFKSLETLGQEAKNRCTKSLGRRRYHTSGVCRYLSLKKPEKSPPMSQQDTEHLLRFSRQRG